MTKRNYLIIGSGGREHAIAHALRRSPNVGRILVLPGNAGMTDVAECISDIRATDIVRIVDFVRQHPDIYMTVVAPDDPLALGLVDALQAAGLRAFGPHAAAAHIEASKAFAKDLMTRYSIPTAAYRAFDDYQAAADYVRTQPHPLVIKADGLALGKGVTICTSVEDSLATLNEVMVLRKYGSAGGKVVIEEFLTGREVSMLAFTDGVTVRPMVSSVDHKRVFDGDQGPNTGGMGAYSPSPIWTEALAERAMNQIFVPTIDALRAEGRPFVGVIYFGLMVCGDDDIRVIEYNARFGDPETQCVLPRLRTDLTLILDACVDQTLAQLDIEWIDQPALCVVMASEGYPANPIVSRPIVIGDLDSDITIYYAGVRDDGGQLVTSGGRVLGVSAVGPDCQQLREHIYANVRRIQFEGCHYRRDILGWAK